MVDIRIDLKKKSNSIHLIVNTIHARTDEYEFLKEYKKAVLADTLQIIASFINSLYLYHKNEIEACEFQLSSVFNRTDGYKKKKKEIVYQAANYYFSNAPFFDPQFNSFFESYLSDKKHLKLEFRFQKDKGINKNSTDQL